MVSFTLVFLFIFLTSVSSDDPCLDEAVISRHQWGSQVRRPRVRRVPPAKRVFIHHSRGKTCANTRECSKLVRELENRHIKVYRFLDIGYNFIIGGDGRVYEGRGWRRQAAQAKGFNNDVGILFLGNFNSERPPEKMLTAARNLLECGINWGVLRQGYSVFGHKNVGCTDCPGSYLYSAITKWKEFARAEALYIDCYPPYKVHSSGVKIILY